MGNVNILSSMYIRKKTGVNNKTCWTEVLPVILLLDHVTSQTTLPFSFRYAYYSQVEKTISEWMRTLSGF